MAFITEELADFIAGFRADGLPDAVLDRAILSTLDCIAAIAGGVGTENAASMREAAKWSFGSGDATAWFTDCRLRPVGALLANCAAASALDVDDGHRGASGHPGAAIVPAVLAAAESQDWDGRKILAAIVLGYDVALRIASARKAGTFKSYAAGLWCGYGVAAALCWLHGLRSNEIAHALAIAGAEAPQNLPQGACRMSSVKGSSPWGTLTAWVAVERARAGATGSIDLLDRESLFAPETIVGDLGQTWRINETYFKPYASCRYTHAAIDAVLELASGSASKNAPIDDLTVEIFPEGLTISNDREPATLEAAQFSIPFSVALAAIRGVRALRPIIDDSLRDEDVLALSRRVSFYPVEEFAGMFPKRTPSRVRLRRGEAETSRTVLDPLGDVANPMSRADITGKLNDLARGWLPDPVVGSIIDGADGLRTSTARDLITAIKTPAIAMQ